MFHIQQLFRTFDPGSAHTGVFIYSGLMRHLFRCVWASADVSFTVLYTC